MQPTVRAFVHCSRAWWFKDNTREAGVVDALYIGLYQADGKGGTDGEFEMQWYIAKSPCPCLRIFEDAWKLLADWRDLFDALAKLHNTNPQPQQICELLLSLGFIDITPTKREED